MLKEAGVVISNFQVSNLECEFEIYKSVYDEQVGIELYTPECSGSRS